MPSENEITDRLAEIKERQRKRAEKAARQIIHTIDSRAEQATNYESKVAEIAVIVLSALREVASGQAEMLPYSCFAHDAVQVFFTNAEYGCPLCAEYDQPALSEIREAVEKLPKRAVFKGYDPHSAVLLADVLNLLDAQEHQL